MFRSISVLFEAHCITWIFSFTISCVSDRIEYLICVLFTVYKCSMCTWNKEMKLGLGSLVDAMSKHSSSGGGIRGMVMEGSCAHVLCTEGLQMGGYLWCG